MLKSKASAIDPAALYRCLVSYVCKNPDGGPDLIAKQDQRLLGSSPVVRAVPSRWAPADTPDDVINDRRQAMRFGAQGGSK